MWAESLGVNKGTTFYIKLPIYRADEPSAEHPSRRPASGQAGPRNA
jgi:hypothetical protein